jgi:hypothetical protein
VALAWTASSLQRRSVPVDLISLPTSDPSRSSPGCKNEIESFWGFSHVTHTEGASPESYFMPPLRTESSSIPVGVVLLLRSPRVCCSRLSYGTDPSKSGTDALPEPPGSAEHCIARAAGTVLCAPPPTKVPHTIGRPASGAMTTQEGAPRGLPPKAGASGHGRRKAGTCPCGESCKWLFLLLWAVVPRELPDVDETDLAGDLGTRTGGPATTRQSRRPRRGAGTAAAAVSMLQRLDAGSCEKRDRLRPTDHGKAPTV